MSECLVAGTFLAGTPRCGGTCLASLPLKIAQRFNAGNPRVIKIFKSRSGTKGAPANKHGSVVPRGDFGFFCQCNPVRQPPDWAIVRGRS